MASRRPSARVVTGLRAGTLNTRLSLQRKAGRDALGQPLNNWTEYGQVWGAVVQIRGVEKVTGGTSVDSASASIRIRYRTDVTNGDRVVALGADNQIFNINSVMPNAASREYTDLVCTENANQGG
jgi:SPP1 family predicted phage head-tail adaptor